MQTKATRTGTAASVAAAALAAIWLAGPTQAGTGEKRTSSPPGKGAAELYAQLYAKRQQQLARLKAYADAGVFPHNTYRQGAVPVFVDGRGVRCAVGELMHHDGASALVEQTRRTNNLVRLHQVHSGPIVAWIQRSGLTKEECEMIQPSYRWRNQPPCSRCGSRIRKHRCKPRPRPIQPPLRADQPAIQARLRATHRLLTKQTAQGLETATRRMLATLSTMAGGKLAFDVVELRGDALSLVPVHAQAEPTWVRLAFLDAQGKLIKTSAWQTWTAGKRLSLESAPTGAVRVLVEQAL